MTVDHLFGTVWTDDTLDLRDRRLLTIGVLAAQDKPELLEIQFDAALERGELTVEQVREVVVHLTHYIGWPLSTGISGAAETVIRRRAGTPASRRVERPTAVPPRSRSRTPRPASGSSPSTGPRCATPSTPPCTRR